MKDILNSDGISVWVVISKIFLDEIDSKNDEIQFLIKNRDFFKLKHVCHKLKSTVGTVGIPKLFILFESIEHDCLNKIQDWGSIESKSQEIFSIIEEVKKEVENEISK